MKKLFLLIFALMLVCFSILSCQQGDDNIAAVSMEDLPKYEIAFVAAKEYSDKASAKKLQDTILSLFVENGISPQKITCELYIAELESCQSKISKFRQEKDLVIALDCRAALATVGMELEAEKDFCPLFYISADDSSAKVLEENKLCYGLRQGDTVKAVSQACTELIGDGKIGVIYPMGDTYICEQICTYFDTAGANYTVISVEGEKIIDKSLLPTDIDALLLPGPQYAVNTDQIPVFCAGALESAAVFCENNLTLSAKTVAQAAVLYLKNGTLPQNHNMGTCPILCQANRTLIEKHRLSYPKGGDGIIVEYVS